MLIPSLSGLGVSVLKPWAWTRSEQDDLLKASLAMTARTDGTASPLGEAA